MPPDPFGIRVPAPTRSINFSLRGGSPDPFGIRQMNPFATQDATQLIATQSKQQERTQLQQDPNLQALDAAVKRNTTGSFLHNVKIAGGKAVAQSAGTAVRQAAQSIPRSVAELDASATGKTLTPNKVGQFFLGKQPVTPLQQQGLQTAQAHPGGFQLGPLHLSPTQAGVGLAAGKGALDIAQLLGIGTGAAKAVDTAKLPLETPKTAKEPATPALPKSNANNPSTLSRVSTAVKQELAGTGKQQAGAIDVPNAKALIDKHQQSVKFTGDIRRFSDSSEGSKGILLNDAAKLTKNRTQLTTDEKAQLQNLRDARMTGQAAPKVSDKVLQADKEATQFAKATIANDVERAKLEGNLQKAQEIAKRDPETYTHRVASGKGSAFDYVLQNDRSNPLSVNLGKGTPADKNRTMFAAVDEAGNRRVVSVKTATGKNALGQKFSKQNQVIAWGDGGKNNEVLGSLVSKKNATGEKPLGIVSRQMGETFKGNDGKVYKLDQATAQEIEKATGTKYFKDPWLTNQAAYLDSRVALENARMFENIKKSPEASTFMSAPGETAPKGWKAVAGLDQFRGYKFEPRTADALHDAFVRGKSEADVLDRTGKVLRQSIVYFPIKHDFNMASAYVVDRGLSSLANPMAYKRMVSSWKTAADAMRTKNELFQKIAKQGFGLTTNDKTEFEKVWKSELQKVSPNKLAPIAKASGLNPVNLYNKLQRLSVWDVQDFLNIARVAERMQPTLLRKGASLEDAVKQTEKYSFQYKVPERVVGTRAGSQLLQSNKVFFGRYRYDQYKILKNIVKGVVDVRNPKDIPQNADRLAALVAGALVVWPIVNKGIQKLSGNPNAYNKAPGPMELLETGKKVLTGKEDIGQAAANQIYLSSGLTLPIQLAQNRDAFTGKQIRDPNTSTKQQAKDTFSFLKSNVAPVQRSSQLKNTKGNQATNIALMLSGTNFPKNSPDANKLNSLKFDTLPNVRSQVKAKVQQGDIAGAKLIADKFNNQVLQSAKAALKAAGQPVPSDQQLYANLKSGQYLVSTSDKTIKNDQAPKQNFLQALTSNKKTGGRTRTKSIFGLPKP